MLTSPWEIEGWKAEQHTKEQFEQAHFWQTCKTFNVDEELGKVESAPTGD